MLIGTGRDFPGVEGLADALSAVGQSSVRVDLAGRGPRGYVSPLACSNRSIIRCVADERSIGCLAL